jgi:hypothetical protein
MTLASSERHRSVGAGDRYVPKGAHRATIAVFVGIVAVGYL